MIVFFSNISKHGNISIYLMGLGNFPFRFVKTTSWQASSWRGAARVNLCHFQATLFVVNLLNSLWEQTCSPLSNHNSCGESQWPNWTHCVLCWELGHELSLGAAPVEELAFGLMVTTATAPRAVRELCTTSAVGLWKAEKKHALSPFMLFPFFFFLLLCFRLFNPALSIALCSSSGILDLLHAPQKNKQVKRLPWRDNT